MNRDEIIMAVEANGPSGIVNGDCIKHLLDENKKLRDHLPDRDCDDGGKCHHRCLGDECFRRRCCAPLSITGCKTWSEFDNMEKKDER